MAIRYSGDVEVRLTFVDGKFRATLRAAGGFAAKGTLTPKEAGLTRKHQPSSSDSYDEAALVFFEEAKKLKRDLPLSLDDRGRILLRRTFQAPCPYRPYHRG